MRETALGILMGLFVICFIAIVIEESLLGGRRRRRLEKEARLRQQAADVSEQISGERIQCE